MESGDYFGEVKFTGAMSKWFAVFNGDIDAGVTWSVLRAIGKTDIIAVHYESGGCGSS